MRIAAVDCGRVEAPPAASTRSALAISSDSTIATVCSASISTSA
jgi:hypothetical protein